MWFITIAAIGVPWIFRRPEVLGAVKEGWNGFGVLHTAAVMEDGSVDRLPDGKRNTFLGRDGRERRDRHDLVAIDDLSVFVAE